MRFCANASILFKEAPFLERFGRVREAGLSVALFNFYAGDMPGGERGLLGDPGRQEQFRENVPVALELARRLGCARINALVGQEIRGLSREEQLELARENVAWAAESGVEVLIEAVNTFENGRQLRVDPRKAPRRRGER